MFRIELSTKKGCKVQEYSYASATGSNISPIQRRKGVVSKLNGQFTTTNTKGKDVSGSFAEFKTNSAGGNAAQETSPLKKWLSQTKRIYE